MMCYPHTIAAAGSLYCSAPADQISPTAAGTRPPCPCEQRLGAAPCSPCAEMGIHGDHGINGANWNSIIDMGNNRKNMGKMREILNSHRNGIRIYTWHFLIELHMVDFPACATIDDAGGYIIYRDLTRYHLGSVDIMRLSPREIWYFIMRDQHSSSAGVCSKCKPLGPSTCYKIIWKI